MIFFSYLSFGQKDTIQTKNNFVSYKEKLGVYIYGISKINNFELEAKDYNSSLRYGPNENFNIGLGFNYKWLGTSIAFNFGFINNDKDIYGDSKSFDSQIDIFTRKYYINTNLQAYQGYYWENPDDFIKTWSISDSALVRPDIRTFNIGSSGIYIFNNQNFSFKAVYQNTERQINSAGSWLVGAKISLFEMDSDSSIIPKSIQKHYETSVNIRGISAINLGGSFGYTYTFIVKEYIYVNMALMLGLNLQAVSMRDFSENTTDSDAQISSNVLLRMGVGCNKPRYFYGLSLSTDSYLIKNPNDTQFSYSYGKFRIFYGRRFTI